MSTLVDASAVTTAIVATLRATISQPPTYILVGDHEHPEPDEGDDPILYVGRPRLEVHRIPLGPPRQYGADTGGFVGQTGAMEWIRHQLTMTKGLTRAHVDAALDQAVAVLTERDVDRSWMYEISMTGQTVIAREPGGRGQVETPAEGDSFSVSCYVDTWVHAGG